MNSYKTIGKVYSAEITEKHSRFIATVTPASTVQEATDFINKIKKDYWDARHNAYAYVLNENNIVRFSDDGEPHSTAGKPILDVINGNGLKDVCIVVTRYFGGILLGTGGLVRAYSSSASLVVQNAEICEMQVCKVIRLNCEYSRFDNLNSFLGGIYGRILNIDYGAGVTVDLYILSSCFDDFCRDITDKFYGTIKINIIEEKLFPVLIKK